MAAVVGGFGLAVVSIGAIPLLQSARALAAAGAEWAPEVARWWRFFDPALPSDALGFVPRTPVIKLAAPEWELMPAALAAVLIAIIVGGGLVTRSEPHVAVEPWRCWLCS